MPELTPAMLDLIGNVQHNKSRDDWVFSMSVPYDEEDVDINELAQSFASSHDVTTKVTSARTADGSVATIRFIGTLEQVAKLMFDFDPTRVYGEAPDQNQVDAVIEHLRSQHA